MWTQLGTILMAAVMMTKYGSVMVDHNVLYTLPTHKKNVPVDIQVRGQDQGGNLDCYVLALTLNNHGWVIVDKDENPRNRCDIHYLPQTDQPLKLWIVNHGKRTTSYVATFTQ